MRLYRYLASVALLPTTGTLLLIAGIYACVDFVEVGALSTIPAGQLVLAYPLKLPTIVAHVLPLALLLGVLLALSGLRRGGEWEALRSAGLSPMRLGLGLLAVPVVGTALALPVVEWLGPVALQRFETGVGFDLVAAEGESVWTVDRAGSLTRRAAIDGCVELQISRDSAGRATVLTVDPFSWRRGAGWSRDVPSDDCDDRAAATMSVTDFDRADGLAGASLSRSELDRAIESLEQSGRDAAPLHAQGALRISLVIACLLVPLLGLLVALRWDEGRATRLVALGLVVGAAYWLVLAAAWNGAVLGAWSAWWVSLGVPGLFAVIAVGAAARVATR